MCRAEALTCKVHILQMPLSRSALLPRCSTPYSEPMDKLATQTCEYIKTHRYPFIRRPGCRSRIINASRTFICGRLDG